MSSCGRVARSEEAAAVLRATGARMRFDPLPRRCQGARPQQRQ